MPRPTTLIAIQFALICTLGSVADCQINPWPGDYRHVHKPQLLDIVEGRYADALTKADAITAKHPNDAESHFFSGIAHANLDNIQSANESMQRALAAGIAPSRFLIGSDPWTRRIREGEEFAWLNEKNKSTVLAGPMLGNVTDSSAQIWIRTARPGTVRIKYSEHPNGTQLTGDTVEVAEEDDLTAVLTIRDLKPNTRYSYAVEFDEEPDSTRTLPGAELTTTGHQTESSRVTIAFGGGAAYLPHKERMWNTIKNYQPDMLLLLGDNVYIDDPMNEIYQRYLYYRRQCQSDFQRLTASTPVYSIWDDHDFGDNDCYGGPLVDVPAWKRPVWKTFKQNWVNPAYGAGDSAPGCWYEFSHGDIQFFMLDGRYYRDPKPDDGSEPTMLGSVQKEWLKRTLSRSTAKVKVLCSPVPWIGGNRDKWTGFKKERDELFTFIETNAIKGIILLSADRHRSDLLVLRRPRGRRYFDFMSSKLTNHHTHRLATEKDGALYSYNEKCSFGLVDFDTTQRKPTVRYRIITIDGEEEFRFDTILDN